jgi:hypothetical protein
MTFLVFLMKISSMFLRVRYYFRAFLFRYSPFFALPTRLRDTTKTFEYFFGVRVF